MSRWVVVDDSSSGISYDGDWLSVIGTSDGTTESSGPPLYNTLHGTHSNASIVFDFKGSSITVFGSHFSSSPPQWACFIDDDEIVPSENSTGNNLQLCSKSIMEGTHRFVVNISATEDGPFWFDNIEYLSSAGMALNGADVAYGWDDSLVQCDSNWDSMENWTMTMKTGSNLLFNFTGISLGWFGVYNNSHPRGPSMATYSVDGESPIPFMLDNQSSEDIPLLSNQPLFQTSKYSPGDHTLEVVYQGHPDITPLTLERLIVQDSTLNAAPVSITATSTVLVTATSIPTQTPLTHKINPNLIASVVGGAIGGFLFLAFISIFIFLLVRQSSRRSNWKNRHPEDNFREVIEPYTHNPLLSRPSDYTPLPTSSKRPLQLGIPRTSNGPVTPQRPHTPRQNTIRNFVDSLATATFGSSRRGTSEGSTHTLLLSTSTSPYGSHTRNPSWVVVHEDSGMRLLSQGQDVVEVPPTYSAR